ncbi:hypothetical protein QEN19_001867 [Hanseniaspora menglaensis]
MDKIVLVACISSVILTLPDSAIKSLEVNLFSNSNEYLKFMAITTISTSIVGVSLFICINHFTSFSRYKKYQINTILSFFSIFLKIVYLNPNKKYFDTFCFYAVMKTLQSLDTTFLIPITMTYLFINEHTNKNELISRLYGYIYLVGFVSPLILNVLMKFHLLSDYEVLYLLLGFQFLQMILIYKYIPRENHNSNKKPLDESCNKSPINYRYCKLTIITTIILKISQLVSFGFIPVIISIGLTKYSCFSSTSLNYLNGIYSLLSLFSFLYLSSFVEKLICRLLLSTDESKQKDHIHLFISNSINLVLNLILAIAINSNVIYLVAATWTYMMLKSLFQYNSNIILLILIKHISMCYTGKKLNSMHNKLFSFFSIMEMPFTSVITFLGFKLYQVHGNSFWFLFIGLFLSIVSFIINLLFLPNIITNQYNENKKTEEMKSLLLMESSLV